MLHGAINAVYGTIRDKVIAEIERTVPVLKEKGGYIFASDHSIPNSVSLENFRAVVETVKEQGPIKAASNPLKIHCIYYCRACALTG